VTAALDHLSLERLAPLMDQYEMAQVRIHMIEQKIEAKRRETVKAVS